MDNTWILSAFQQLYRLQTRSNIVDWKIIVPSLLPYFTASTIEHQGTIDLKSLEEIGQ